MTPLSISTSSLWSLNRQNAGKNDFTVRFCTLRKSSSAVNTCIIIFSFIIHFLGMFAIQTDHAANLSRHVDGHMTWTYKKTVSVLLAWIGFDDSHSNIRHYSVNIGSSFFSSDLNQVLKQNTNYSFYISKLFLL